MPDRVEVAAPAKVNLRLCILAREEGGYHALETVFCAISLADRIVVTRGDPGIRLSVEGAVDVGPPERNLAVRAAEAFHRALGVAPAIDLHLVKHIPAAAGLGGGSSDAAAVLLALNALHDDALSRPQLAQIAIELGADVPFFVCGSSCALAWGRGERMMPLPPLPSRPVLVAHPGVAMSTAEAFGEVAALRGGGYVPEATLIDLDALRSWEGVAALARNDFEPIVVRRSPLLSAGLAAMRDAGARIALLAGSGASIFAIFDDGAARDAAAEAIDALGMRTWRAETLESTE